MILWLINTINKLQFNVQCNKFLLQHQGTNANTYYKRKSYFLFVCYYAKIAGMILISFATVIDFTLVSNTGYSK